MSETCNHDCSSCSQSCESRDPKSFLEKPHEKSTIRKVIGVVSGKGGVGKSMVSSMLAANFQKKGYRTAVMDADITGPSIPKAFGITGRAMGNEEGIYPALSKTGIQIMSVNLLLENVTDPVIWRGPVIAGTVKQFWQEVIWDNVDYMFVDMPPGTGDVPLTVFQSLPLDGIIIVTSPQELVSMIVKKAVNMANAMDIPILGIVENYSYVQCDCCGKKMSVFGESHVDEVAQECELKVLAKLPLDSAIAKQVDAGKIEELDADYLEEASAFIEQVCPCVKEDKWEKIAVAVETDGEVSAHFNACKTFMIYEIEEDKLTSEKECSITENTQEAIEACLTEAGVNVLICGGIGFGAIQALMAKNIMVVPGQQGNAKKAVEDFLTQ